MRTYLSAAVLAACLLMSVSCGSAPQEQEKNTEPSGTTAAASEAVTAPERVKADLPDRDFGGETVTFFARIYDGGTWSAEDVVVKETDGDLINDAVYERTAYIEDTYNVSLEVVPSNDAVMVAPIRNFISAGETTYNAVVCDVYDAGTIALEGMFHDLNDVKNIDLSKPWWSQMTNDSLTIAGKQYYATGDIFIVDNKGTRVFFFNKGMIAEFDLENPYQLVFDNQWTIEKYMELSDTVTGDLNGDNAIRREDDRFGTMAQDTLGTVLYIAAGEHFTVKDENDMPQIACSSERAISVMTEISDLMRNSDSISLDGSNKLNGQYPDNFVYFMDGRVLFAPDVLKHIETMRGSEIDIGILPPPKFDAAQESYYCYADGWCVNTVSIPVTNTESEKTGFILEAMAADSANNLTPAYYEVALTDKYMRDMESVRMLDLILDSAVMDNANIFHWANVEEALYGSIAKDGKIASTVEKKIKPLEKAIEKTVKALTDHA